MIERYSKRFCACLTLLVFMGFFSGWLRADVYKEKRTGAEFPEKIDSYKRGKVTPYEAEPDKTGVAIEYRSDDAEVTVYVRPLGNAVGKTGAEFLEESLAGVKTLEAQGQYSNLKIYEFAADKENPGWKSAAFTSSSSNRFIVSFIHCKVVPGHLVKIRATTENPKNESLQAFAKSLQEIVDRTAKKK